ncbi:MAG: hypothetical protein IPJ82_15740 [Lewinellaceae bacterium]|nr:hypothetical protein [Lewinellaceae bacterium]
MEFVINEWYLDWHRPDESPENQAKARKFLEWLTTGEHRIVLLRGSPFHRKLNVYSSSIGYPMTQFLKVFFGKIFDNPEKCRILETPPELPFEILKKLSVGNFASDCDLFQSAETTDEKIIVTTDTKLMKHFEGNGRFELWSVEMFMAKFEIQ